MCSSRVPGCMTTVCRCAPPCGSRCGIDLGMSSGRWMNRPPPQTTFNSCMPRPMPSMGIFRCCTILQSMRSDSSRRSGTTVTDGCGVRPILRGSRSSPPVSITPSSRSRIGARSTSLMQRRNEHGQCVGRQQAFEVAAVHVAVRRPALGRRTVVGVDSDQWTVFHGSHPFLEMDSAKSVVRSVVCVDDVRYPIDPSITSHRSGKGGRVYRGTSRISRKNRPRSRIFFEKCPEVADWEAR